MATGLLAIYQRKAQRWKYCVCRARFRRSESLIDASERCAVNRLFSPNPADADAVVEATKDAFAQSQRHLLQLLTMRDLECGTTALVAQVCVVHGLCAALLTTLQIAGRKLVVANVGDSRGLLVRTNAEGELQAIPLSSDHSFAREDERAVCG